MLVNQVLELLGEDEQTTSIRSACHLSYRQCLADFAFAVVYASSFYTAKTFRASLSSPKGTDNGPLNILEGLRRDFVFPQYLRHRAILKPIPEMARARRGIEIHLGIVSQAIMSPRHFPFYRDWTVREATLYLGEDSTLYTTTVSADHLKYNVDVPYPRESHLQQLVLRDAVLRLVTAIRSSLGSRAEEMTQLALEEFVTRTVLGLVSAMWERDLAAEPAKIWHVPHVARSIIKLQSVNHISYQRHLRFLIVTHALHFALKHIGKYNRGDLVPALLAMRGIEPFKQIREILADDGLLIMSPSVEQEVKALKRLEQIRELTIQGGASQDQVRLAQNAALREIDQVSADDFERRLCGVFPELDPRASNN
jgi:hypothetical protein